MFYQTVRTRGSKQCCKCCNVTFCSRIRISGHSLNRQNSEGVKARQIQLTVCRLGKSRGKRSRTQSWDLCFFFFCFFSFSTKSISSPSASSSARCRFFFIYIVHNCFQLRLKRTILATSILQIVPLIPYTALAHLDLTVQLSFS